MKKMKKKKYMPPYTRSKGVHLEDAICAASAQVTTQDDETAPIRVESYGSIDNSTINFGSTSDDMGRGIIYE